MIESDINYHQRFKENHKTTMYTLPNIITIVRMLVIPFFVLIFYLPFKSAHLIAVIIFIIASITDWLDGYLARSLKQTTKLGAFLDPVADKLMVSIALVMIVGEFQSINGPKQVIFFPAAVLTIPAAIIVSREIIVSALREWMAEIGKRTSVAVSHLGKIKTVVQMIAVALLLYCGPTTSAYLILLGYILLYVAAVLTIWSMILYLKTAWPDLTSHSEK